MSFKSRKFIAMSSKQPAIELTLKGVREFLGKTQVEVAEAAGCSKAKISQIENGTEHSISTLRDHIAALGGELNILAHFNDKTIDLLGR